MGILRITILFVFPVLIWTQTTDSKPDLTPPNEDNLKEFVQERLDDIAAEPAVAPPEAELSQEDSVPEETESPQEQEELLDTAAPSIQAIPGVNLTRDRAPEWVLYMKNGEIGKISDGASFFGVGRSRRSQTEADSAARIEFAKNVETRVESSYQEIASVSNNKEDYNLEITTEVKTNLSLKGISITAIWYDENEKTYYSLVKVPRDEYNRLLEQNIREELAMQETRLAQERSRVESEAEEKRLADLAEQNRLEEKARALEEERRRHELKEQRKEVIRRKYARFLNRTPQSQLIGFRNGQLDPLPFRFGLAFGIVPGISPFDGGQLIQRFSFGLTIFQFIELYGVSSFQDYSDSFSWACQELGAKIRLLNNAGDTMRISLGAGGNVRFYEIFENNEMSATFFASGVLSVPVLLHSDFSFYLGLDKLSLGLVTQPLFPLFGDSLALIGEVSYLLNNNLRKEDYDDGFLFQAGFRFKTGKHIATTLSLEDHYKVVLSTDLTF